MIDIAKAGQAISGWIRRWVPKVIGEWSWEAPEWLRVVGRLGARSGKYILDDSRRITALLLVLGSLGGAAYWYRSRPKPKYVGYKVEEPQISRYSETGLSYIDPLAIEFDKPVARIEDVGKSPAAGIAMSPEIAGVWHWEGDRRLEFRPKADWPIDAEIVVKLGRKKLFADGVVLEEENPEFRTKPFEAKLVESSFYQDPRDPNLKKMVATVGFSHPVDVGVFERKIALEVAKDAEYLGLRGDSRRFTVAYDKWKLHAFVHSVPLAMPKDDTPMTLRIAKGVQAERGGNEMGTVIETVVIIPGRGSLRFSGLEMMLVDNARYEPEQVLTVGSSSPVIEQALNGKVTAYLLPVRHPQQRAEDLEPYAWRDVSKIGKEILGKSQKLALSYVGDGAGELTHGFKMQAPVGRYVFLEVQQGVDGVGGYFSAKPYVDLVQVIPYVQALKFLGEGALLSQSGDRKVGFVARDVDHVEVEIGRVLPNQLPHFGDRMYRFAKPSLDRDVKDRIVERFTSVRSYKNQTPGKPIYDSVDLGKYLQSRGPGLRGLFLLRLRSVSGTDTKENEDSDTDYGSDDGQQGLDERLILITDLGLVVKEAKNGSQDVFVQSIRSGLPVEGVRVEVLGKNGLALMGATTDGTGRASLPKLPDLRRDKTPTMLVAQKDADYSFMRLRSQDRKLELSRFDTGGVENAANAQQLNAYLYSDRGIYRPGETANLGMIVRTADWGGSLGGLPVEVEITDSRGAIVDRESLRLSPAAFEEIRYTSQPSSPTGTYQATAYLARDPRKRERLGATNFKVQEFEPDRMKVALELGGRAGEGWLRPSDVKAKATVMHLFGSAAGQRRVEAEIGLSAALPAFARHADYRFQLSETLKEPYRENLAAVITDVQGVAEFKMDLGRFSSRAYRLSMLVRAFEAEGGRNVPAQNSAIISDASYLVGVKPDGPLDFVKRGSARQARWLAVDPKLDPVAAEGLSMEWVERKYVSVLTQQSNQTYRFVSRLKEVSRESKKVRVAAGGSALPIPTQEPGDFVLVLRDAKGAELNRLSYSVAGEANLSRTLDRDAELQIRLDKPAYKGGDVIEASIRAPYVGSGLITIEREKVFHHQWFRTTTTSSVQRIVLPRDFEGNGYVNIQFVRDPSSDELFLSPLSYGVAAFAADTTPRRQSVEVEAAKEVKPGATLVMKVKVAEASRVAVLAVDEGILQVARYRNPDPLAYFFQKQMLEVETSQILDLILPEFRKLSTTAAPGGDGDGGFAKHLNPFSKKRRAPVAYWSGLVDAGPGEKEFRYVVPDYFNGKIRIVAVAVSPRRIGVGEAGTEVKGPFILSPNVPSMVAPGDEVLVSVGVYNNTVGGKGPVRVETQAGPGLMAMSASGLSLEIGDKKEGVGEFRFKATPLLGAVSLKFVARRGNLESRIEESISVRPSAAYRTTLSVGRLDGPSKAVALNRNVYPEKRTVEAAVSALPLVWGQGVAQWLEVYPYSCTEQLVSKGMADLVMMARPEFAASRPGRPALFGSTVSLLQSRANDRGGFGLWASSPETSEYGTVWAGLYLVEAQERGMKVPAALLSNLNVWLARFAATPASSLEDGRARAFAVYLLARQGIQANAALSNVQQELSQRYTKVWNTDLAAGWLAATYRLMQRSDDAEKILRGVPWARGRQNWGEELYYDSTGHDAQMIYLVAKHFPGRVASIPASALEDIGTAINDRRVVSLSAAQILLALDVYAKTAGSSLKLGLSEVNREGRETALNASAGAIARAPVGESAAQVRFSKNGPTAAYYSLSEGGFDRNAPPAALSNGVEVFKEYLDAKGNVATRFQVGEEFQVRLRMRSGSRERLRQMAVVDVLPGGVEPVIEIRPSAENVDPAMRPGGYASLPIGVPGASNWTPQHVNVREDRVILFGDLSKNVATFVYRVRATNAGIFQGPAVYVEGMYEPKINAQGMGVKIEIVKP